MAPLTGGDGIRDSKLFVSVDGGLTWIPWTGAVVPATSGGYASYSANLAASNNAASVKAAAGQVYGVHAFNNTGVPFFVKLYDKAAAPAPATDTVKRRFAVQAGERLDLYFPAGIPFGVGVGIAVVQGISDTDNTATALNDGTVELDYA